MPKNKRKKSGHPHHNHDSEYSGAGINPQAGNAEKEGIQGSAYPEDDRKHKHKKSNHDDMDIVDGLILLLLLKENGFFEDDFIVPDIEEFTKKNEKAENCCKSDPHKHSNNHCNTKHTDNLNNINTLINADNTDGISNIENIENNINNDKSININNAEVPEKHGSKLSEEDYFDSGDFTEFTEPLEEDED